ncbi:MAG: M15 family metallopeptidase [Alloprevotella sp.]
MKKLFPTLSALLLWAAFPLCMAAQQASGLSRTERAMVQQGLTDISEAIPGLPVSLMYTRSDNFTGRVLYKDLHRAYLHPEAARALKKARAALKKKRPDLDLKVYDAARPLSIQQQMYDVVKNTPQNIYVSNPKNGGGLHNYGLAVDITLCCAATGDTLPMGTKIDNMTVLAHVREEAQLVRQGRLSRQAVENRQLLREVMAAGGFRVLPTEWWHFNLKSRKEARRSYKVIR